MKTKHLDKHKDAKRSDQEAARKVESKAFMASLQKSKWIR